MPQFESACAKGGNPHEMCRYHEAEPVPGPGPDAGLDEPDHGLRIEQEVLLRQRGPAVCAQQRQFLQLHSRHAQAHGVAQLRQVYLRTALEARK